MMRLVLRTRRTWAKRSATASAPRAAGQNHTGSRCAFPVPDTMIGALAERAGLYQSVSWRSRTGGRPYRAQAEGYGEPQRRKPAQDEVRRVDARGRGREEDRERRRHPEEQKRGEDVPPPGEQQGNDREDEVVVVAQVERREGHGEAGEVAVRLGSPPKRQGERQRERQERAEVGRPVGLESLPGLGHPVQAPALLERPQDRRGVVIGSVEEEVLQRDHVVGELAGVQAQLLDVREPRIAAVG